MQNRLEGYKVDLTLLRLLQLVSPSLPVGAFAYSQGLEFAVHAGWIDDETTTRDWLQGQLSHGMATLDAPLALRMYAALAQSEHAKFLHWNEFLYAARESRQAQEQEQQTSRSLAKLLVSLGVESAQACLRLPRLCFASVFILAAQQWRIEAHAAVQGMLWSWLENQCLAAVKLVPLGQTAGQRLLLASAACIENIVQQADEIPDEDIGNALPMSCMAAVMHENLYSRLFRS